MQALGSWSKGESGVVCAAEATPTVTVRVAAEGRVSEHRDVDDVLFAAGLSSVSARLRASGPEWLYPLVRDLLQLAEQYLIQGPVAASRAIRARLMLAHGVYYAGALSTDSARMRGAAMAASGHGMASKVTAKFQLAQRHAYP